MFKKYLNLTDDEDVLYNYCQKGFELYREFLMDSEIQKIKNEFRKLKKVVLINCIKTKNLKAFVGILKG